VTAALIAMAGAAGALARYQVDLAAGGRSVDGAVGGGEHNPWPCGCAVVVHRRAAANT
jgi:hypothetical protein